MRVDRASLVIRAERDAVYRAWVDPEALVAWLPPAGMRGELDVFEPSDGGRFHMTLTYQDAESAPGKTSAGTDSVEARFIEIRPNERIVQLVEFKSEDPAFAGEMTMTWTFSAHEDGTLVEIAATGVPAGISPEDHHEGMSSSLANLARFMERPG